VLQKYAVTDNKTVHIYDKNCSLFTELTATHQKLQNHIKMILLSLDLSRRPPIAGQAPLAALRGSLGLTYVQLSCVTDVGLVCVVERYDLTELKEYYYYYYQRTTA